MSAKIIDGKVISQELKSNLMQEVNSMQQQYGRVPGLVTILVGQHPSSKSYVLKKNTMAKDLGYYSVMEEMPESIPQQELLEKIEQYNADELIDGILVQLPLPKHINVYSVLSAIDPKKDVDGFHPKNMGHLLQGFGEGDAKSLGYIPHIPCTPKGIKHLIDSTGISTVGKEFVMVGASNIVGKPMGSLMLQQGVDATVTICHKATVDLPSHCKRADILIVAIGSPEFIRGAWIKPGAIVIDVGINQVGTKVTSSGKNVAIIKGDVNFTEASEVAGYITPVPGGVGPMTVIMLMSNTMNAFKNKFL